MPSRENDHLNIGVALNPSFEWYCRELTTEIRDAFPDIDVRWAKFENEMPLLMVGSADHILMPAIINGDNWEKALMETMITGSALTINPDKAGANCRRLSIFFPFADLRQDQRTRKPVPDSTDCAIVQKQFIFTKMLASVLKHPTGARDVTALEMHSDLAFKAFIDEGLDTMNVSCMGLLAEHISSHPDLLGGNLETIIGTTDFGDLNRAYPLHLLLNFPIAVVEKQRIASEDGTMSEISQKLIYGDPYGKRVILVDDLISGGGTANDAVKLYEKLGAAEIIIFIPHPICVGNYYENLQRVLKNPKVKHIIVTNSIPFTTRFSGVVSIPYIGIGENRKAVELIDINRLQLDVMKAILTTPKLSDAKKILGYHNWDMRDPFELACEITGLKLSRSEDNYIYQGNGSYLPINS
jgi:phosphoribosylpyrophosphate synthetase